jgi:hypothetical protein
MKRKLPPRSRRHEYWCAIYDGKPCNCDDDGRERRRRNPPLSGGGAPKQKQEEPQEA